MPAMLPTSQRSLCALATLLDKENEAEFQMYANASHAVLLTCKSSNIDKESACHPLKFVTPTAARNASTKLSTNSAITFQTHPPSNAASRDRKTLRSRRKPTAVKKAYTDKDVIITNEYTEQIEYLSQTYNGKTHDKKVADIEDIHYLPSSGLKKDTGLQGYEPQGVCTLHPKKKTKGEELGIADKFFNHLISSVRIRVEHVIASIKHCRIVKDVFRNTKKGFSDLAMSVVCALHNFRVSLRHPLRKLPVTSYCR